jgi:predicted RNA polymerase sigma factor
MTLAASQAIAVTRALEAVMRNDRGRLLSALIAQLRDFQLAEEVLQEAAISALSNWGRAGLPASPQGWLLRVALRRAIDRLRSGKRDTRRAAEMAVLAVDEADETEPYMIPDERLRLIFTAKSRVALTLRTLGGLTTPEIARAFLDQDTTMGQRLSRAKAKISAAGIPFVVPGPDDWSERLNSVLTVVYLIFNAGYTIGPGTNRDLCAEAIFLARMLDQLRPGEAEVEGCLALMMITQARSLARIDALGATVPLTEQDRTLWNSDMITDGLALIDTAIARHAAGPFQIKAAIAACHVQDAGPDWPQIAALYSGLLHYEPTPVVALNRAVAVAESGDLSRALGEISALAGLLDDYQPYHAARADLLARSGQPAESHEAFTRAIAMAASAADAAFLTKRRNRLML